MFRMSAGVICAAVCLFAAQGSTAADRVDVRQTQQQARIAEGIGDGSITVREARRLRAEQRVINRVERRVERDGEVTRKEQARLRHLQNKASRDIYRQKHDAQERK